tara:strand:+ start:4888 stop:5454 length:567 start_codon:yes stop_codon:yes gene_type:complete
MNKVLIGYFRVLLFFLIPIWIDIPSSFEIKLYLSDLIHGGHTPEMRNSPSVKTILFLTYGLGSFYILQTVIYIFVGGPLQERNTSLWNFLRLVWDAVKEIRSDKHFWSSANDSNSNFRNIDQVLSYRDNKMAFMSNAQAAELLKKTSHIDTLRNSAELKQSRKVLSYLNNKVALMDNESALDYIQNKD